MCLIAFDWQPGSNRPLTLISNRDEFYDRSSRSAHFWESDPNIYGGKDLKMGGTWLAVSDDFRFAAVTNFRQPDNTEYPLSRGQIPSDFLTSKLSAKNWCTEYHHSLDDFGGFNALLFDGQDLVYLSNRNGANATLIKAGSYGLSNHLLDTPWPKVKKAKTALSKYQQETTEQLHACLLNDFQDKAVANDSDLPDTGVGIDLERLLSPVFIQSNTYGTRTSTAVSFFDNGSIHFTERNYHPTDNQTLSFSDCTQHIQCDR